MGDNMQNMLVFVIFTCFFRGTANQFGGDECTTYTFNVPQHGAECRQIGGDPDYNEALKSLITSQHAVLEQQLNAMNEALTRLSSQSGEENEPEQTGPSIGGLIYTQWGKTTCPDTSEILYQGFTGKAAHNHGGGGVNYLCLPRDPEFPEGVQSGHQSQSYIYGTEYERHNSPLLDQSFHDNDAPCAVCEVSGRTRLLMIPAKMTCPAGWTHEYDGLLMAQHHNQANSDYICVSKDMEVLHGGSGNANGALLYVVEAVCGSLKCPPYTEGYEIACVVCTK